MAGLDMNKAAVLWAKWHNLHDVCIQAFSLANNICERLEQPNLQEAVVRKQLASLDKALAVIRDRHEALRGVVRDMERLYVDANHKLSASRQLWAHTAHTGPRPSALECIEALHDMWLMCRDELMLKVAAVGLIAISMPAADMAALFHCYADQPNLERDKIDRVLALMQETRDDK
eukprot:GHRR01030507.1.p1 GENE.GHRR01030507.1~~GHRR01030507.1.p1  ORF type:complete len:175 (+),score=44.48 GHRR01030507.1:52-576(+)